MGRTQQRVGDGRAGMSDEEGRRGGPCRRAQTVGRQRGESTSNMSEQSVAWRGEIPRWLKPGRPLT